MNQNFLSKQNEPENVNCKMTDTARNVNAFASTFLFFATHNVNAEKIKKSLQANALRQTKMGGHNTTEKKTTNR